MRILSIVSRRLKIDSKAFDELVVRMAGVCERLNYVDDLSEIKKKYVDFYSAGWFKTAYLASFVSTYKDPFEYAVCTCAYLQPLTSYHYDVHPDWSEESGILMEKSQLLMHSMITDISSLVLTLLKFLWDFVTNLEGQYHLIEAANRLEKSQQPKKKATNAQDLLPGYESETWAKKSIEKLVLIRRHLSMILTSCTSSDFQGTEVSIDVTTNEATSGMIVGSKIYNIASFLHKQITTFFELHLSTILTSNDKMTRPSAAYHRLMCGYKVLHFVMGFLPADLASVICDALFKETNDVKITPPSAPVLIFTELLNKKSLICKVSNWFVEFAHEIASPKSFVLWAPQQLCFLDIVHSKQYVTNNESSPQRRLSVTELKNAPATRIDLCLDPMDLQQLLSIIGLPGGKAINSQLLTFVATQVKVVLMFLKKFKTNLKDIDTNCCSCSPAYCAALRSVLSNSSNTENNSSNTNTNNRENKGLSEANCSVDSLLEALINIGVALIMREMVGTAVRAACESNKNATLRGLYASVQAAVNSISPLEALASLRSTPSTTAQQQAHSVTAVCCLAADMGIKGQGQDDVDIALAASLSQLPLSSSDLKLLQLFPMAAAVTFLSEKWTKSTFYPALEAFDSNEHCAQYAIAKLLLCFHVMLQSTSSMDGMATGSLLSKTISGAVKRSKSIGGKKVDKVKTEDHATVSSSNAEDVPHHNAENDLNNVAKPVSVKSSSLSKPVVRMPPSVLSLAYPSRYAFKSYADKYLRVSSVLLLKMRGSKDTPKDGGSITEGNIALNAHNTAALQSFSLMPLRCMSSLLEYFIKCCPIEMRGHFQKYYPAVLVHSDMLEISLGRCKQGDVLNSFIHHSEDVALANSAAVSFSMNESAASLITADLMTDGAEDNRGFN